MNAATQALIILTQMQNQLDQLRQQTLAEQAFSQWVNQHPLLLDTLPDKYRLVLNDLLNRLEAGSMFTEESCSFSQRDLHGSLQLWLDKARAQLQSAAEASSPVH